MVQFVKYKIEYNFELINAQNMVEEKAVAFLLVLGLLDDEDSERKRRGETLDWKCRPVYSNIIIYT